MKVMVIVDSWKPPELIDKWGARIAGLVARQAELLDKALRKAATENARMFVGTGYAQEIYDFLRTFCSPVSCKHVAAALHKLANDELEAGHRRRDTDAGLRGKRVR